MLTTVLDRTENRMKQQTPTHPKNEAAQKPKRAIFPSLELIGRGGGGEDERGGAVGAVKSFNIVCLRF